MIKKVWIESASHEHFCAYVLEFFNHHPLVGKKLWLEMTSHKDEASIYYCTQIPTQSKGNIFFIPAQNLFFNDKKIGNDQLSINAYQIGPEKVYSVEKQKRTNDKLIDNNLFSFDLMETIFFHLSRYEEVHFDSSKRNQWGMMPEQEHLLVKNNLQNRPLVDQLVASILKSFGFFSSDQLSRMTISHDIDYLKRPKGFLNKLYQFFYFLKNGGKIQSSFFTSFSKKFEYYNDFSFLVNAKIEWSKRIYFHMGGEHHFDPPNIIGLENIIQKLSKEAIKCKYKVGIHPSFLAAQNGHLFQIEKNKLEQIIDSKVEVSRQHFLHFDFEKTISILEKNGISEDSSLGYNEHVGFRCGTGFDYYLYDWQLNRKSKVKERPLIWMDSSQRYAVNKVSRRFKTEAKTFFSSNKYNTAININIHNNNWVDYPILGIDLQSIIQVIQE